MKVNWDQHKPGWWVLWREKCRLLTAGVQLQWTPGYGKTSVGKTQGTQALSGISGMISVGVISCPSFSEHPGSLWGTQGLFWLFSDGSGGTFLVFSIYKLWWLGGCWDCELSETWAWRGRGDRECAKGHCPGSGCCLMRKLHLCQVRGSAAQHTVSIQGQEWTAMIYILHYCVHDDFCGEKRDQNRWYGQEENLCWQVDWGQVHPLLHQWPKPGAHVLNWVMLIFCSSSDCLCDWRKDADKQGPHLVLTCVCTHCLTSEVGLKVFNKTLYLERKKRNKCTKEGGRRKLSSVSLGFLLE